MNKGDKTVYQYGSFEPTLDPSYISLDNTFKCEVSYPVAYLLDLFPTYCGFQLQYGVKGHINRRAEKVNKFLELAIYGDSYST
jgi:hypothetical protein